MYLAIGISKEYGSSVGPALAIRKDKDELDKLLNEWGTDKYVITIVKIDSENEVFNFVSRSSIVCKDVPVS